MPRPLRDPILSFSHTFSPKSARVTGPRPSLTGPRPLREILDPPLICLIHCYPVRQHLIFFHTDKIEELDLAPVQDLVNFYGGFPAANSSWDPSTFDLTELAAKLIRTFPWTQLLFNVDVSLPFEDNAVYGINVRENKKKSGIQIFQTGKLFRK